MKHQHKDIVTSNTEDRESSQNIAEKQTIEDVLIELKMEEYHINFVEQEVDKETV